MNDTPHPNLQWLQTVLEHYGADHTHWPPDDRELIDFIWQDLRAEQLWQEAGALDQLLDSGHFEEWGEPQKTIDLQTRILADFSALHAVKKSIVVSSVRKEDNGHTELFESVEWIIPVSLAACFAIGIHLGGIGFGDRILDFANSLAALSSSGDQWTDIAELVMSSGLEEDLL